MTAGSSSSKPFVELKPFLVQWKKPTLTLTPRVWILFWANLNRQHVTQLSDFTATP